MHTVALVMDNHLQPVNVSILKWAELFARARCEVCPVYCDHGNHVKARRAPPAPLHASPVWKLVWMSARLFLFLVP